MAIDLTPARSFKEMFDLAFFQGTLSNVFKMRKIRKSLASGDIASAKRLTELVNSRSNMTKNNRDDELAMMVHHGGLLFRLGGVEPAMEEYLLPAVRRYLDGSFTARARDLLESIVEAGGDSPEVQKLLEQVRS